MGNSAYKCIGDRGMRIIAPIVSLLVFLLAWIVVPVPQIPPAEPDTLLEYFFYYESYPTDYVREGEEKTFRGTIYFWRPDGLRMDEVKITPPEPWKLWVNVTIEVRELGVKRKVILRRYIELGKDEKYTLNFNYTGQASTQHKLYVEIRHGAIIGGEGMVGIVSERKPPIRFLVYPIYRKVPDILHAKYVRLISLLALSIVAGVVTELVRRARKGKLRKQINQ